MRRLWKYLRNPLITVTIVGIVSWAVIGAEVSPRNTILGIPNILKYLSHMVPPDGSILSRMVEPLAETFQIAIVAIIISVIVALPMSFLGAKNIVPNNFVYQTARTAFGMLRGIPPLLYAVFLVAMVGLGPFAGVLALSLHTIGALGRYFSEAVENINPEIINSAKAAGANKLQIIIHVVVPELKVLFLGYILYYFESNVRHSTTLGLVGAGGIGLLLITQIHLFRYKEVGTLMLVIVAIIAIMDRLSFMARARLIKG